MLGEFGGQLERQLGGARPERQDRVATVVGCHWAGERTFKVNSRQARWIEKGHRERERERDAACRGPQDQGARAREQRNHQDQKEATRSNAGASG